MARVPTDLHKQSAHPGRRWLHQAGHAPAIALSVLMSLGLAACSASGGGIQSTPTPGREAPIRKPVSAPPRDPQFQHAPGLQGVIGANQAELERQFGKPRLDVWEGDARKLQFTGTACLLDIYLYPTTHSRTPLATWVDARRASDGRDVDRGACVAALRKR